MKNSRQPPDEILRLLRASPGLRIHAGSGEHRSIGIWHVVVKDRVFVRSWSVQENGWYRTFERPAWDDPGEEAIDRDRPETNREQSAARRD